MKSQKKRKSNKNDYAFRVDDYLKDILAVDLTKVNGFSENTLLNILSETGTDLSKWKNDKHFTSWAGLSPKPKISGDKLLGHFKNKNSSRVNQAFKLAAWGLNNSKCHLGAMYRRLSIRKGSGIAVQAVARKLAVIFYNMIKNKTEYKGMSAEEYQEKNKQRKLKSLEKQAQKMGLKLEKI